VDFGTLRGHDQRESSPRAKGWLAGYLTWRRRGRYGGYEEGGGGGENIGNPSSRMEMHGSVRTMACGVMGKGEMMSGLETHVHCTEDVQQDRFDVSMDKHGRLMREEGDSGGAGPWRPVICAMIDFWFLDVGDGGDADGLGTRRKARRWGIVIVGLVLRISSYAWSCSIGTRWGSEGGILAPGLRESLLSPPPGRIRR
jgi:hypothetical protein